MTDDTKIISAIRALHERAFSPGWGKVELSRLDQTRHIVRFVGRCKFDVTPPIWDRMFHYVLAVSAAQGAKFSPKSIAHLQTVAKECLK